MLESNRGFPPRGWEDVLVLRAVRACVGNGSVYRSI